MLPTSKQVSNGNEDFMCIKTPFLRLRLWSPTPVSQQQQWAMPAVPVLQNTASTKQGQEEACREHFQPQG